MTHAIRSKPTASSTASPLEIVEQRSPRESRRFELPQEHAHVLLGEVGRAVAGQRHRHVVPVELPVAGLLAGFRRESVVEQLALHLPTGYLRRHVPPVRSP